MRKGLIQTCRICGVTLTSENAYLNRQKGVGVFQSTCKTCSLRYTKFWLEKNHDRELVRRKIYYENHKEQAKKSSRKVHLRAKYGLTEEEFTKMLEQQNGLCAICLRVPATSVDHDHLTGKVRSLLCNACNTILGLALENTIILKNAAAYLESKMP